MHIWGLQACFSVLMVCLLVAVSEVAAGKQAANEVESSLNCNPQAVDIVFLLDESGSIEADDFREIKNFVINLTSQMRIDNSSETSRVGVIKFGTTPEPVFILSEYSSKEDVHNAILSMQKRNGNTDIAQAMTLAMDEFFTLSGGDRPEMRNVMIVVTDGRQDWDTLDELRAAALRASRADMDVWAIGIGHDATRESLENITLDESRVTEVATFNELNDIVPVLCKEIEHAITEQEMEATTTEFMETQFMATSAVARGSHSTWHMMRVTSGQTKVTTESQTTTNDQFTSESAILITFTTDSSSYNATNETGLQVLPIVVPIVQKSSWAEFLRKWWWLLLFPLCLLFFLMCAGFVMRNVKQRPETHEICAIYKVSTQNASLSDVATIQKASSSKLVPSHYPNIRLERLSSSIKTELEISEIEEEWLSRRRDNQSTTTFGSKIEGHTSVSPSPAINHDSVYPNIEQEMANEAEVLATAELSSDSSKLAGMHHQPMEKPKISPKPTIGAKPEFDRFSVVDPEVESDFSNRAEVIQVNQQGASTESIQAFGDESCSTDTKPITSLEKSLIKHSI